MTPTPERKCPIRVSDWRKEEAIPLCPVNNCAHPLLRGEKVCPCHTPESRLRELEKEAMNLINDRRTGLRDSSDTNKTRYSLLGLIEDAYKLGLSQEREDLVGEVKNLPPYIEHDSIDPIGGEKTTHVEAVYKDHVLALLTSKN